MSNTGNFFKNDAIREIAAGTITGAYQVLGGPLVHRTYVLVITNNTNGDIYISEDGVTDQRKLPAGTSRIYDYKTDDGVKGNGTQFQIRYAVVPAAPAGWAAIEAEYT